jgi:hypothetical protein
MIENLDELKEDISEVEWTTMGLKAWLAEDRQMRMHVVTTTPSGKWVSLGWISKLLFFEDRTAAERAANRIVCGINRRSVRHV